MERKKYPEDFKRNAVQLLLTSGKTQKALCEELGIAYGLLGRWRKEYDLSRPENADLKSAADARILALEKEVAILRQERDILKKVARFRNETALGIALKI